MNGSGFGICGHRNSYNSGVRHGNWVEDLIGTDLHAQGFERGKVTSEQYATTASASYIHPAAMPNKCDKGAPNTELGPLADSRVGLSYDMMFQHGKDFAGTDDEVPPRAALGPVPLKIGSAVTNAKMTERTKALARADREISARVSEATSMNLTTGKPPVVFQVSPVTKDGEPPAPIPRFHRSSKFSAGTGDFHETA